MPVFLCESVIQCCSSTKRNIISAHLSFPRLKYDLNKNHTKAVSHGKNTGTGVRKPGLQPEPLVALWEVTQLQGYKCFCKWHRTLWAPCRSKAWCWRTLRPSARLKFWLWKQWDPNRRGSRRFCDVPPETCFARGVAGVASWGLTRVSTPRSREDWHGRGWPFSPSRAPHSLLQLPRLTN